MSLTIRSAQTIQGGVRLIGNQANTGGSMYFDGTSSWLSTSQASDLTPGAGDFTVEWWQNMDPASAANARLWEIGGWPSTLWGVSLEGSSSPSLLYWDSQTSSYNNGGAVPINTWAHVAIVRQSNTLKFYINGSVVYTSSDSRNINNSGNIQLTLGAESGGAGNTLWKGYLTNLRINLNAVYTAAFTPPSAPLTADANTKLLMLAHDGTSAFSDSSGLNHTFTQHGAGVNWTSNTPFTG